MGTITYLVANYNNARYVEDCLVSLKNQSCDRWRCIVCDDHSTDDSVAIIKRHLDSRIRLLENSKNVGYIGTLKRMIAAAPSDIVGILDSDDALEKDATACVLQAYADDKNAGFVFTRFAYMDENLRCQLRVSGAPDFTNARPSALLDTDGASHLKTFRKSLYYRTQGLDESMLYAEDRDLVYKLQEATRPVFIDEVLYKYRVTRNSQSHGDPVSTVIGMRNHLRARKNVLHRRNATGLYYALHLVHSTVYCHMYVYEASTKIHLRCLASILRKIEPRLRRTLRARRGESDV